MNCFYDYSKFNLEYSLIIFALKLISFVVVFFVLIFMFLRCPVEVFRLALKHISHFYIKVPYHPREDEADLAPSKIFSYAISRSDREHLYCMALVLIVRTRFIGDGALKPTVWCEV